MSAHSVRRDGAGGSPPATSAPPAMSLLSNVHLAAQAVALTGLLVTALACGAALGITVIR